VNSRTQGTAPDTAQGKLAQRVLPLLLLLPAALLALPGPLSLLADDPFPHLAGTGWTLLAFVPLAAWLLLNGLRIGQGAILCGGLLFLAILTSFRELSDPLEARRSLCQLLCLTIAFVGATQLSRSGRRRLELGAIWLSILWTGFSLGSRLAGSGHLAGVLGDTGSLSQAALPGAVVGGLYAATRRGRASILGLVAAVLFVLHAGWTPVLAGGSAWVAALVYTSMASPWSKRHARPRRILGLLAASGVASLILFHGVPTNETGGDGGGVVLAQEKGQPSGSHLQTVMASTLGGFGVRGHIWGRTLVMLGDHPILGVGPGQFQAAFPPYRSPAEIESSRLGACREENTEVEHAHCDPLQGLSEYGLLGGVLWLWILIRVAIASRAALRSGEAHSTALGAAGLALFLNAFMHTPLLANPVAGPLAFAIFGALIARTTTSYVSPSAIPRIVFGIVVLVITLQAPTLIRHGRALAGYIDAVRELEGLETKGEDEAVQTERLSQTEAARHSFERALEIAPRSAEARLLSARHDEKASRRYVAWLEVLEVRPYSVEAQEGAGILKAREGNLELARHHLQRASSLSPTNPRILKNLAQLEFRIGDLERAKAWLQRLRVTGCGDPAWRSGLGAELVLSEGRMEAGGWLLGGAELKDLSPEELHASYRDESSGETQRVRDALECLAQLLWARHHAANGSFELALRNYRQAQRMSLAWSDAGAISLRLERAAAEAGAGRADTAREVLGRLQRVPENIDALDLPDWALRALPTLLPDDT